MSAVAAPSSIRPRRSGPPALQKLWMLCAAGGFLFTAVFGMTLALLLDKI